MTLSNNQLNSDTREDKKDVFICYSSKDRAFVRKLAEDLKAHGVKVWWDKWEMIVGDSITKKIQEGISKSSWLIVVLSPDSIKSNWVGKELSTAQVIEVERQKVFILPILYKTADIPIFLKDKVFADFRRSYKEGFSALIERFSPDLEPQITGGLMSEDRSKIFTAYSRISKESKKKYIDFLTGKLYGPNDSDKLASMMALFTIRCKNLSQHLLSMAGDS